MRPEEDIELGLWNDRFAVMKGSQAAFVSERVVIVMCSLLGCKVEFISRSRNRAATAASMQFFQASPSFECGKDC